MAIGLAAAFVALTVLALFLPGTLRQGTWLPLHLLLAGAATTAIAGVMPFFSAAVSGAPPAPIAVRLAGVIGVASGALLVVAGRLLAFELGTGWSSLAGAGGVIYIGGLIAVGAATLLPLRAALGPRRIVMGAIYGVALVNLAIGATLATTFLFGWQPVVGAWATLKPAHAWLNLFGFVSLVIAGSMLHLLPTVAGARISRTRASVVCFAALSTGPSVVALGYAVQIDWLAIAGVASVILGAGALCVHAASVVRARARWTTDPGWHLFTTWSLVAGCAWFLGGAALAALPVLSSGASAVGWQLAPLVAPIGAGWVAQVLIGAWSHLVPAVGPGTPERHAAQRQLLGRAGLARLTALNIGVVILLAGHATQSDLLSGVGGLMVAIAAGLAVLLVAVALLGRLSGDARHGARVVGAATLRP